jgi:glyceraldehyde-3-phosphate dehydrogenase/erythrose-4-phosphate dehydrogenase
LLINSFIISWSSLSAATCNTNCLKQIWPLLCPKAMLSFE